MAGQSISAHADAATVAALKMAAAREGRSTSQITASSLRLYLGLPGAVRAALQDVDALGSTEDKHNLMRAMARTVASAQYEIARRHLRGDVHADDAGDSTADASILDEAVRMTDQSR